MSTPILTTKLYIPPPRPNLTPRPRLLTRLNRGLHGRLTLVSAPAGFGKTTLISAWLASIARAERAVAWLSLDEGDNDLRRFLEYLVAALRQMTTEPGRPPSDTPIGESLLRSLQAPQLPALEPALTQLLNEIAALPLPFILVLDDYHVIDTSIIHTNTIDQALTFLLDHLPPQMHLVITTREDPPLPLARLRTRGQLTEVRAGDLRFTVDEATDFLNEAMGLALSPYQIRALEERTEGWVAGLQLAALALQGTQAMDAPGSIDHFIQSFAGDNRYIVDYLLEEVLHSQPEATRTFLLQTAILERLSGPLCDAVTGRADGAQLLRTLEQSNLFVIPLDQQRHWYRYHHLFADVLKTRALEEQPGDVPQWHQRASTWYEAHGQRTEAIRHALAAQDVERAAELMELAWPSVHREQLLLTDLLVWMEALPQAVIAQRPLLCVGIAWEQLNSARLDAADFWLQKAERWLSADGLSMVSGSKDHTSEEHAGNDRGEMRIANEADFRLFLPEVAAARAFHALAVGDVPGSMAYARRALHLFPPDDYVGRGPSAAMLGLAHWTQGELEEAHRVLAESMDGFQRAGNVLFAISGTYGLADMRITQGRLRVAMQRYEQTLRLALTHMGLPPGQMPDAHAPVLQGTADLYLGLSELHRERGELDAARTHLEKSLELGERAALQTWPYRVRIAQARMAQIDGDWDSALHLLDEAEARYYRDPIPDVRPIATQRVRVWIAQGRWREALEWAQVNGLSVDDELTYLQEFQHITLARALLAQGVYESAMVEAKGQDLPALVCFLERLLRAAEAGGRFGSVIEILLLQALFHEAAGDRAAALDPLARALDLAEPEGYVRIFVDEGLPMARLLTEFLSRNADRVYARQLLARLNGRESTALQSNHASASVSASANLSLIEPLSDRELEVLQLIADGLTNREIANRLYLSLHTVKVHARNIYGKLAVKNRTQAVAKGRALDLLASS